MTSNTEVLHSIQASADGLTLVELLTRHPDLARRTVQRMIATLIEERRITAMGKARARRYFRVDAPSKAGAPAAPAGWFT